jgi:hypothetical protein
LQFSPGSGRQMRKKAKDVDIFSKQVPAKNFSTNHHIHNLRPQ